MPPAKLYKYQRCIDLTLANLRDRTIWFSAPADFNDPFDCALQVVQSDWSDLDVERGLKWIRKTVRLTPPEEALLDDPESQPALRDMVRLLLSRSLDDEINRNLNDRGVTCFAESPNELLMWSHYTNGHRGFCVEFDTATLVNDLRQVRYKRDVPQLNPLDFLEGTGAPESLVEAMMLAKAECWGYEREWRILSDRCHWAYRCAPEAVTAVYLGTSITPQDAERIRGALAGSKVQVLQMRRHNRQFAVVADE